MKAGFWLYLMYCYLVITVTVFVTLWQDKTAYIIIEIDDVVSNQLPYLLTLLLFHCVFRGDVRNGHKPKRPQLRIAIPGSRIPS